MLRFHALNVRYKKRAAAQRAAANGAAAGGTKGSKGGNGSKDTGVFHELRGDPPYLVAPPSCCPYPCPYCTPPPPTVDPPLLLPLPVSLLYTHPPTVVPPLPPPPTLINNRISQPSPPL